MSIGHRTISVLVAIAMAGSGMLGASAAPPRSKPLTNRDVTPGLANVVRLGRMDPGQTMSVTVSLALRNQAALGHFIAAVSDPRSPSYGRYLRPEQFTALFGPSPAQVTQVVDYLRGQGLTIASVSANRTLVQASGPARAVQAAFGVSLWNWHDPAERRDFFGNDSQPVLPASLASAIVGVAGLNDHYQARRIGRVNPPPRPSPRKGVGRLAGNGPGGGYTPTELKSAYDIAPLDALGYRGSGQSLGLMELDAFNPTNIATYDSHYGLATQPTTLVLVGDATGKPDSNQLEVELDIEVMHAIAPSAPITVWEGPNSAQGVIDAYNAMVVSDSTPVNSTSWGLCEAATSPSQMLALDEIFKQAAAQGQSFFAASGDSGAYDCASSNTLAVDNPASDPYVTAVGGTRLSLAAGGGYFAESAWSAAGPSPQLGSGGGLSQQFSRPAWQAGPGVANAFSTQNREVPDVALDSDPQTGYSVYTTSNGTTTWYVVAGTSAAAPAWAALAAILNQYQVAAGGRGVRLGFANPALYQLATANFPYPPFHDVTTGDNLYYVATVGWDYATGWGSYDAYNLVRDLTLPTLPPPLPQTPARPSRER